MALDPQIVRRDKASKHVRQPGEIYQGVVTSTRDDGNVYVKIPSLSITSGPVMPLNSSPSNRLSVGDVVACSFNNSYNSSLIVFGTATQASDDYSISRYQTSAERDSSITSPQEGRVVYILNTDELQIYNGSSWITVVDTGNSENITAETLIATSASIGTLTVTGASTLTVLGSTNLTASTSIGSITPTELSYLDGVTSGIQAQINTKSPSASPSFTGQATVRAAATQDGIILQGRAGGTGTYSITLTPGTLTASRTITLPDTAGTVVTTGDSGTVTSTMIANDTIVNADINSAAAIVDTKLATISTAGKVSNSATTATSGNTANAIVARDASGNFTAGTVTAALSGTVSSSGEIATTGHIRSGATGLTDAGSVSATNWFRSTGGSGWYNATYAGGIWMSDSTWVRVYNSKNFYCDSELRANRYSGDGTARYGSYGSISITGTKGGYAGMDNDNTSSAFMWTNNICGHYYNNNSWNWYFDRGTLRLLGSSDYVLSYVDNNAGLPWCKGPYLQGSNGWAFLNNTTGAWEMGQRYAPGGQNYAWIRGGLLVGTTPDDGFAGAATVAIKGSLSVDTLPNSTALDATFINVGGQNWKLAFNSFSTRKVKQDIGPIGAELDPSKLLNLDVVQFKYKPDHLTETDAIYDKFVCGLIAEDVAEIYPIVVRNDIETGEPQSINYTLLIPPLLALVQKMSSKIDSLEERISTLENA